MNKTDLIAKIAEEAELSKKSAEAAFAVSIASFEKRQLATIMAAIKSPQTLFFMCCFLR